MATVSVEFNTDIFSTLRRSPEEVAREMRVAAVVVWFAQGRISQGKAAEIAGISRAEFLDALAESNVPVCRMTEEELEQEMMRE